MSNMLETWMVLHAWLLLLLHHLVTVRCCSGIPGLLLTALVILVVVSAAFIREVLRAFVFVRSSILLKVSPQPYLSPQPCDTHILKSSDRLIDITGGIFVELLVVTKNDDGHVDGAQHRELVGLLEQSALSLEEGYRPGRRQGELAGRAWHSRQ